MPERGRKDRPKEGRRSEPKKAAVKRGSAASDGQSNSLWRTEEGRKEGSKDGMKTEEEKEEAKKGTKEKAIPNEDESTVKFTSVRTKVTHRQISIGIKNIFFSDYCFHGFN